MNKWFAGWETKQCADCVFCKKKGKRMQCNLFIMPFFVWGEYTLSKSRDAWAKQGLKLSPKKCWGYCNDEGELLRRTQAIKAYTSIKKPKKEAV